MHFRAARVRALVARDPLLVFAFALLWAASLAPIWAPRLLPLLDLPNHLAAVAIWHRFGDPAWGYSHFYRLNRLPLPYWGYLLPMSLLAHVAPIEIANKLVLSLYALALPVGAALLARQMGRSHWLALFAFPLVFNASFQFGFVTFCIGLAVLPFALWALDRFLQAPSRGRAVALGLMTLALYFSHVLPWLFFGVAAAVLLGCHGFRPRRIALAAGLMLPSVAVAAWGFSAAARGATAVQSGPLHFSAKFIPLLDAIRQVPTSLVAGWPSSGGASWVVLLLGLCWLALVLTAEDDEREPAPAGFAYRLELIAALGALAALLLPVHLYRPVDLWNIGQRFVAVAALFFALLPRGALTERRRLILLPVIAIALLYPLSLTHHWRAFNERAQAVRRLCEKIPRGKSTLTLIYGDGTDPDVDTQAVPYLMFHAYPQLWSGGFDAWGLQTGFPMVRIPDRALPAPIWKHPEKFDFDTQGCAWDYLLTKGEISDGAILGRGESDRVTLVGHDGDFRLYRVKSPHVPEP